MVLFSLLVVGCSAVADLIPAEGEVLLASVTGSEEALAAEGSFASVSAQPEADRPDPMRECDGASTYEAVFGRYDADADGALDALETEEVRSERAFRAEDESRRVRHQWELLVLLYDVDGDGTLGESERATLLPAPFARPSADTPSALMARTGALQHPHSVAQPPAPSAPRSHAEADA
jgi:hypothetical protein